MRVRITIRGKWYSNKVGTWLPLMSTSEITAVRFDGYGVVKVPTAFVTPA